MKTENMNDQLIADAMADFEKSNLSSEEFCQLYEITAATFVQWKQRFNSLKKPQGMFVPIGTSDLSDVETQSSYAELVFPAGHVLRMGGAIDPVLIKALIN